MSDFDLADVCDDITTYGTYQSVTGSLTYETLNRAIRALQQSSSYEFDYNYENYWLGNWNFGRSSSENNMEQKFKVGDVVKIINHYCGVGGHEIGVIGEIVDRHGRYWNIKDSDGDVFYNGDEELELFSRRKECIESTYVNQIASDLAKLK